MGLNTEQRANALIKAGDRTLVPRFEYTTVLNCRVKDSVRRKMPTILNLAPKEQKNKRLTMEDTAPLLTSNQKLLYSVVWALVLLCIGWPLAWFIAPVWIFLLPFESILQPGTSLLVGHWQSRVLCIMREFSLFLLYVMGLALEFLSLTHTLVLIIYLAVSFTAREVNVFLEKMITWPRTLGAAIRESQTTFPSPLD
jgi:hypothetical protein